MSQSEGDTLKLELTPELEESGVVISFVFFKNMNSVILSLNHIYNKKILICKIDSFNWSKTSDTFTKQLKKKQISHKHIEQLEDALDKNYARILGLNGDDDKENNNKNSTSSTDNDEKTNDSDDVDITVEEWHTKLTEKYQNLRDVAQRNLPNLWYSLEFELSVLKILNIKDCTLPFAGIVLGPPSSLKTVGVELFRKSRNTFYTDNFSARSFVSHSTGVSREKLQEIDMLPKIKNKCFLTPELAPTFATKDEDLIQILGIMTRILDGRGYESDTGAHGHRGYNEEIMFTWIGAAVDIPRKVHKLLGTLGPKLYFLRLPKVEKSEDDYYEQIKTDDFAKKINEIHNALIDYLEWFESCPSMSKENGIPKMQWNSEMNEEVAQKYIIKLARLLARLRGVVPTWHTQGTQGSDYAYGLPTIEEPERAIQQLTNLARGHALSLGRNYITMEDIPLITKVILSTASIERVTIFDLLLANGGKLTSTQITTSLNTTKPTALRTMTELKALGLVDMKETATEGMDIALKSEYDWFLTEKFQTLREKIQPVSESEQNKGDMRQEQEEYGDEACKEKTSPNTPDILTSDKESIFWEKYDTLEREEEERSSNHYEVDKNTVSGQELKMELVSSGRFFIGDAVQIIDDMVKAGRLDRISFDTYRRSMKYNDKVN
jgi:hypothetical protein